MEHGDIMVSTYIRKCLDTGKQFDTNILLGGRPSTDSEENEDTESILSLLSEEVEDETKKEAISANSMIDVLVAFLECLPDPIIPTNMYERALEVGDSADAMNNVIMIYLNFSFIWLFT